MAQSKVRCPHCRFSIVLVGSQKGVDSIDCPKCNQRVQLKFNWHDTVSNDHRAAFAGWSAARNPDSVSETIHEDEPVYITEGGVTRRIVRRVFRRIVRRSVRVGSRAQQVQWEVDWSWLTYLIYGLGICLLVAILAFGPGYALVRQFTGDNFTGAGGANPFSYLADNWRSLEYVNVNAFVGIRTGLARPLSAPLEQIRQDSLLGPFSTEINRLFESEDEFGSTQVVVFKRSIEDGRLTRGKPQASGGGISIYRTGSYYSFQPNQRLLVRSSTLEGAKAALNRMGGAPAAAPRIANDEDFVFWSRQVGAARMRAPGAAWLSTVDPALLDRFGVVSQRIDFHAGRNCRIRIALEVGDSAAAVSLANKLNEVKTSIRTMHARERTFNGMSKDTPENAALTLLESGEFVAHDQWVQGETSVDESVLVGACQALANGYDVNRLIRNSGESPTSQTATAKTSVDSNASAVAARTESSPRREANNGAEARPSRKETATSTTREVATKGIDFDKLPDAEAARIKMVEKFGADRVVTVVVRNLPTDYPQGTIVDFLSHSPAGDATAIFAAGHSEELEVVLAPIVDVASLAGQISFGEVDFDNARRTLSVKVSRVNALPKVGRPKPRPLADPRRRLQLSDVRVEQLLADIKAAAGAQKVNPALLELADADPIEASRAHVASQLLAAMESARETTSNNFALAFANWAKLENVSKLIELLDDRKPELFALLLYRFAEFKDDRPLEALSKNFSRHWQMIGPVFENIGDSAEKPAIALLQSQDGAALLELVRVLKVIGGKDSIPALEAARKRNPAISKEAGEAMAIIEQNI